MAEEEFQESEVIFSDNTTDIPATHDHDDDEGGGGYLVSRGGFSRNTITSNKKKTTIKKKKKVTAASSLPVNIPSHHGSLFHYGGGANFEHQFEDDDVEEREIEPPHVILGRRIAGKMAFSVCTGNGRTLKGRDLSQVRNSILRMTGFLEA